MKLKAKKVKKIQSSLHLSPEVDQEVRNRTLVSKRSFSTEIEYILEKYFQMTDQYNRDAIAMTEKHKLSQTE